MNFAHEPIPMYEDFHETIYTAFDDPNGYWLDNFTQTDNDVCVDTSEQIDMLLYAKRMATYMKYIYLFWFVFLAITVYYDHTRTRTIQVDPEVERKMRMLEERMKKSVGKIKKEMKKFKKNMKKLRRSNKEIYRLQQQICDHYDGDDETTTGL